MTVVRHVTTIAKTIGWAFALSLSFSLVDLSPIIAQDDTDRSDASQSTANLKDDVLEWVDELDAPSLATRQSAERSLIKAGTKVLPLLPESKPGLSAEATQRLRRVRDALRKLRTQEEADRKSTPIRLDQAITIGEALEAISAGSGVEFEHNANESQKFIPIEAPLSFWHALDLVLDQAELDINFYGGDRTTLQLVPRGGERASRVDSAAYTGVYRIEPTSTTSRLHLRQPGLSGLNIGIEISWEPGLTPIGLTIPIDQLSGKLDDGAALQPQDSGGTIDLATSGEIAFSEFYLPMQLPAGQPKRIESLSGVIRALLPGDRQSFELELGEPDSSQTIDAMTVRVETVRKNGPLHEIRLGIDLEDAGRSLESHRQWIFENDVYVRRKDGTRADVLGFEVYRQTDSGVGVGYLFDLGDTVADSTLIYESPTAVVPNEVSFVIQDISLP